MATYAFSNGFDVSTVTGGSRGANGTLSFSDPFLLPSSETMPREFRTALDYCAFLWGLNPVYQQANARVCGYFITDIDFTDASGDKREQKDYRAFLQDHLNIFGFLAEIGDDYGAYGNAFARVHRPFIRHLVDYRSGRRQEYSLGTFEGIPDGIRYDPTNMRYDVVDPHTMGRATKDWGRVSLDFIDRESSDWSRIRLMRLWPQHVILHHSIWSGTNRIIWEIDRDLVRDVKAGILYQINETPRDILQAISRDYNYQFADGEVFHLKAPTISGLTNGGWGLPPVIRNFRNIHQLQVYRKIDEAIGLDYVLPFRVFTPGEAAAKEFTNGTTRTALMEWRQHASRMVSMRRANPFNMYAMPLPIQMQSFGHDQAALMTKDQLSWHTDHLLAGMGVPAELYHGTLNVLQMPPAVRMFESQFRFLGHGFNALTRWASDKVRDFLGLEAMPLRLQPNRLADNIEKQALQIQMLSAGELPREEAWRDILNGRDPMALIRRKVVEDLEAQRIQMEEQTKFEREQTMGSLNDRVQAEQAGAAGGAPGPGAMNPLDRMDDARQTAMEMLAIPYLGERQKALRQLEATDPTKHALVKAEMEKRRREGESAGRQSVQGGGEPVQ